MSNIQEIGKRVSETDLFLALPFFGMKKGEAPEDYLKKLRENIPVYSLNTFEGLRKHILGIDYMFENPVEFAEQYLANISSSRLSTALQYQEKYRTQNLGKDNNVSSKYEGFRGILNTLSENGLEKTVQNNLKRIINNFAFTRYESFLENEDCSKNFSYIFDELNNNRPELLKKHLFFEIGEDNFSNGEPQKFILVVGKDDFNNQNLGLVSYSEKFLGLDPAFYSHGNIAKKFSEIKNLEHINLYLKDSGILKPNEFGAISGGWIDKDYRIYGKSDTYSYLFNNIAEKIVKIIKKK